MRYFSLFFVLSCLITLVAFGQDVPVEVPTTFDEIIQDLVALVTNWKALGVLGGLSGLISILVKLCKTSLLGGWFDKLNPYLKRAIVVILGIVSGILLSIAGGMVWWQALVAGLISSGGAIAIYEVLKPFFNKPSVPVQPAQ